MLKRNLLLVFGSMILCLFLASCGFSQNGEPTRAPSTISLEDCQLSSPGNLMRLPAQCGTFSVAENPADPNGKKIDLHLAVLPAISRNPAADPIFFVPGGPGEAATQSYLVLSNAFETLRQKRDIVLVDQRGTGKSNPLTCPVEETEPLEGESESAQIEKAVQDCLNQVPGDPRFYTTAIAMDDLDQVRAALGYPQINLYGASYGTRAVLAYMRQHPDRVRSAILDGVAPPDWELGPTSASIAQKALDAIFTRCQEQPDCQAAFPDLRAEFERMMSRLEAGPIQVTLDDPMTGEPSDIELTPSLVANAIHMLSYTPETTALLPLMIHAAANEDWTILAAQVYTTFSSVAESITPGMRYSILCAEDVPFFSENTPGEGYLGDFVPQTFESICRVWPQGEIPADYKQPVESQAPVLLISGEDDPATPPENGTLAAKTLPNSLHLIAPGQGHINLYRGCIPLLATDFIESGSVQGLDTSCVQNIQPMPFFINYSGPRP